MPSRPKAYISIGHLAPRPWTMKNHRHPFHELIVVIRGTTTVRIAQQQIVAHGGDILFYPREVWHQEWSDPDDPVETFYISWRGTMVPRDLLTHDANGRVRVLVQWLYEEYLSTYSGIDELRHAYLQAILTEIGRLALSPEPGELVNTIRAYLHDHLVEPLTLDDLARQASMSKFHFVRKYKHLTGRTPIKDLQTIRMEFARNLMITTDLPLKTIAGRAGLCNEYYLCRLFRNYFGTTPSAFRGKSQR